MQSQGTLPNFSPPPDPSSPELRFYFCPDATPSSWQAGGWGSTWDAGDRTRVRPGLAACEAKAHRCALSLSLSTRPRPRDSGRPKACGARASPPRGRAAARPETRRVPALPARGLAPQAAEGLRGADTRRHALASPGRREEKQCEAPAHHRRKRAHHLGGVRRERRPDRACARVEDCPAPEVSDVASDWL